MIRPRQICLSGYMGVGKSTVGALLAQRVARPFIDLDQVIEADAERSIPAIFASEGEPGFRAREAAALARVLAGPAAVVALGGGAVVAPSNRAAARAAGWLVTLTAAPDVLRARLGHGAGRPLAAGDPLARFAARQAAYADCDLTVSTDGRTPAQVAAAIHEALA